jgi:hypothetical protein
MKTAIATLGLLAPVGFGGAGELDPYGMTKGDTGTLPAQTPSRKYVVMSVWGEDVLVGMREPQTGFFDIAAMFFINDKDVVAKARKLDHGGNMSLEIPITLTATFEVIGEREIGRTGRFVARLRQK